MATSNFLVFAEGVTSDNIQSDSVYAADTQRTNGVVPGIAVPAMHNKLYKQATIMAAAIAQVIVQAGFDALDSDYTGLVANLRQAFCGSVNGVKPDAKGNIDITTVLETIKAMATPEIGDIICTKNATNPSKKYAGTTWQLLGQNQFLMSAGSGASAGSTGGSNTHTLTVNELPSHTHTASTGGAGSHTHAATCSTTGAHYHGSPMSEPYNFKSLWPTFGYYDTTNGHVGSNGGLDHDNSIWATSTDGNHSHTVTLASAGNHTHSVTVDSTGGGASFDTRPQYLAVYMWIRTA